MEFFHHAQLGFNELLVTEKSFSDESFSGKMQIPEALRSKLVEELKGKKIMEAKTTHNIYDEQGNVSGIGTFDKDEMESEGTKKVIEMSGPIFDTLRLGKVLIVDELDAKLHPLLTRSILQLFMNPETNPHGAQLIFATHDTNLLNLVIRFGLPRKTRLNRPTFIPCLSSRTKTVRKSEMTEVCKRIISTDVMELSLS